MSEVVRPESILADGLTRHPELQSCESQIRSAFHALCDSYQKGGKTLLAGNGGSAADCAHIAGELVKGFMLPRHVTDMNKQEMSERYGDSAGQTAANLQLGLPAIDFTAQSGLLTAFVNDVHPEYVFAQLVYVYGQPQDVFWGISTSGRSKNVLRALEVADWKGMTTLLLTGPESGPADDYADHVIHVPGENVYQIQELHLPVYHLLCLMLEAYFFGSGAA